MEFIDTHTHNSDEAYLGCEDEVIRRAEQAGVTAMIQADIDSRERTRMYELSSKYPGLLYNMLGLYPGSVDKGWRDEIDALMQWKDRGPVAVGEIGLDYHFGTEFKEEQKAGTRFRVGSAGQHPPAGRHGGLLRHHGGLPPSAPEGQPPRIQRKL